MGIIRYKDIAYGGGSAVTEGYYKVADGKFYEHFDGTTYSDEITGEDGILYVDLSTNNLYRWSTGASLFVLVGKSTLASLNDTNIATPTDGQALEYNGTSSKWVNVAKKAADTPTFSEASTRANLSGSGETMATILGKIKKWFTDLKDLAFIGKDGTSSTKYLRGDGTWQAFPTIPTVNDATLTIQKNGTTVETFTANSATAKTANIAVPTKTSDLTNDSGFVTTDEKVTGQTQNPSSITGYSVPFIGTTNQKPYINDGFRYNTREGTSSQVGYGNIDLGNNKSSGTAGNKAGTLSIYSQKSGYVALRAKENSTSARAIYFPDNSGTVALVEDFSTASVNYATSAGSATDSTKIPLAGSSAITGDLIPSADKGFSIGSSSKTLNWLYSYNARFTQLNTYAIGDNGAGLHFDSDPLPSADDVYDLGSSSFRWQSMYLSGSHNNSGASGNWQWVHGHSEINGYFRHVYLQGYTKSITVSSSYGNMKYLTMGMPIPSYLGWNASNGWILSITPQCTSGLNFCSPTSADNSSVSFYLACASTESSKNFLINVHLICPVT